MYKLIRKAAVSLVAGCFLLTACGKIPAEITEGITHVAEEGKEKTAETREEGKEASEELKKEEEQAFPAHSEDDGQPEEGTIFTGAVEGLPGFSVEGSTDLPGHFFLSFVYSRNLIMTDGKGNVVWSKHEDQPEG